MTAASDRATVTGISLISVPYHAGDDRHPAAGGPPRLVDAGAANLLTAQGHDVSVECVDRGAPFRDTASSSAAVNAKLAASVRGAHASARLPVVLAGSCVACHGVVAGLASADLGAVWLDAHADFNTPETTVSGFFPGMSLAVATGHCYAEYLAALGAGAELTEDAVVLLGVRDLSPEAERERLERSAIDVVTWRAGQPEEDPIAALDRLVSRARSVYLHVDFDCFSPDVAPGVADDPVPGGVSGQQAEEIIRATADRFHIAAVTLATYAPVADPDERTLRLALRLIEVLGECAHDVPGERGAGGS